MGSGMGKWEVGKREKEECCWWIGWLIEVELFGVGLQVGCRVTGWEWSDRVGVE